MSLSRANEISLRKRRAAIRNADQHILERHSFADIVNLVNSTLIEEFDDRIDRRSYNVIRSKVDVIVTRHDLYIPGIPHSRLVEQIVDSITGYGILHPFVANKNITNIEVEGPSDVFVMENLKYRQVPISFESEAKLQDYIYRLFNRLGGRFSEDNPLAKVEDPDWNLRIRAGGFDVRPDSPTLSIRKLRKDPLNAEEIRYAMSEDIEAFLKFSCRAGFNIAIIGPFGGGKTTLLGTLLSWVPPYKHIGLIQSANEIQRVHPLMRRTLTRSMVGEEGALIDEATALEHAKQENYQCISLGELLGGPATVTMQHIMQLGIQTMFSYHANDPLNAPSSFHHMARQTGDVLEGNYFMQEFANNMDLLVIMDRLRVRNIFQYTGEIDGLTGMPVFKSLYEFEIMSENRHQLIGRWKKSHEAKLCQKLLNKARLNGEPVPEELQLI